VQIEVALKSRDRYGQLLVSIWREGLLVQEQLVREALCVPYTVPPNVDYVERIRAAAELARHDGLGIYEPARPLLESPRSTASAGQPWIWREWPPPTPRLEGAELLTARVNRPGGRLSERLLRCVEDEQVHRFPYRSGGGRPAVSLELGESTGEDVVGQKLQRRETAEADLVQPLQRIVGEALLNGDVSPPREPLPLEGPHQIVAPWHSPPIEIPRLWKEVEQGNRFDDLARGGAHHRTASRPDHSPQFAERHRDVGEMVVDHRQKREIDAVGGQRQRLRGGGDEANGVREARGALIEHRQGRLHRNHGARVDIG
jgi:Staphylococcal nuclease homologue